MASSALRYRRPTAAPKAASSSSPVTWRSNSRSRAYASILNRLDHEYGSDGILPDLRGTNQPADLTEFEVPFSPECKAAVNFVYDVSLTNGSRVSLAANINYQDEAQTDVLDRANLTDEIYRIAALPVDGLWNFTHYGPPLSVGLTLNFNFK